ncbi:MAG: hypothetical protein PHI28_03005 [Mangrovibacterium sp.]|nr:hypothetical protein [Mangrovibacterium sp.]
MINEKISEQINTLSREIYAKEQDLQKMVNGAHYDIVDVLDICLQIMLLQSRMIALKEIVQDPDPRVKSNQNIN